MFMFSFRLRRLHVLLGGAALVIVLALGIISIKSAFAPDTAQAGAKPAQTVSRNSSKKISGKSNDDRLSFLTSYGWTVEPDPIEILEVIIPQEFDEVYEAYNDMQKRQGFDLSGQAGKRCKRYAYRITGYPGSEEPVRAHVLVYKDKIIGGDVSSEISGSFMHGFEMS